VSGSERDIGHTGKTAKPRPEGASSPSHPVISGAGGNLYLIGYRGAGKSTVARLLAETLGWPCVDMDQLLESRSGLSIREIFAAEGEAGFRLREAALLEEISRLGRHVVATGGGVVLSSSNRRLLRGSGRAVWLTADSRTSWQRLQGDPATPDRRPNLTVGGPEEIEELLKTREPYYRECADCTVETAGRSAAEVASLIRTHLNLS
jgi:shikimate kinase